MKPPLTVIAKQISNCQLFMVLFYLTQIKVRVIQSNIFFLNLLIYASDVINEKHVYQVSRTKIPIKKPIRSTWLLVERALLRYTFVVRSPFD